VLGRIPRGQAGLFLYSDAQRSHPGNLNIPARLGNKTWDGGGKREAWPVCWLERKQGVLYKMNEDGCAWYCGLKKSRGLGRRAEVHPATLMKMDAKGHAACQPRVE
jgi:hypothetical protein